MLTLLSKAEVSILCKDDPVREHLDAEFRTSFGRLVYGLYEEGVVSAVCCVAFLYDVPREEKDLVSLSMNMTPDPFDPDCPENFVISPYTIWSYSRKAGVRLLYEILETVRITCPKVKPRVVTLSPVTELARKFHTQNGALLIKENENSLNFEYPVFGELQTATVYDLDYYKDRRCSK